MKKHLLFTIAFVALMAAKDSGTDYSKILPGVVKVNELVYYDKTEITNFNWLEYLQSLKQTSLEKYHAALPDSNVWINDLSYNEPYVEYYLRHVAYREYPVVGISWQQAVDYCQWRTERLEEHLNSSGKRDKAPKHFVYRLPTKDEFLMMYSDIADLPNKIGEEGQKKYRDMYRYNMKKSVEESSPQAGQLYDNADVTAPVLSYWPNSFGVYNIKGNVAEWLFEPNTYTGGAWNTPLSGDASLILSVEKPSASIGFRCVCEVMDEAL